MCGTTHTTLLVGMDYLGGESLKGARVFPFYILLLFELATQNTLFEF